MKLTDLRSILQYIPQFREKTFIISLDGAIVTEENFSNILLDVAVLREDREMADRARGVDLHDLLAGQPADGVEVMDRGVPEQAARRCDVVVRRGRVVVGDQPDQVDVAQRAAPDPRSQTTA